MRRALRDVTLVFAQPVVRGWAVTGRAAAAAGLGAGAASGAAAGAAAGTAWVTTGAGASVGHDLSSLPCSP